MSFCSFADGAAMLDATPIENLFLMEYMFDAPEQALKVYLYARMLALHPELGGSAADLGKVLRMTEEEVLQAFGYWERRELMERVSDQPPCYRLKPLRGQTGGATALDQEIYANRDFNNRLQKLFGNVLIGQHELNKAADWVELLHLDKDAVVRLVAFGIETSVRDKPKPPSVFKRMDALAEEWSRQGIRTLADVERAIAEEKWLTTTKAVMKKLGMKRTPTDPELALVKRWTEEWGFSREAILSACDDTVAGRNPSFKYLDTILDARRGDGDGRYRALCEVLRELNPQSAQPTPDQQARYAALLQEGFDPALIRLAAIQCHRANKYRFDDLEWRLHVWRQDGVSTPEEAEQYMREMGALSRQLRGVFQAAGFVDRRPGYSDLQAYRRWRDVYPEELIRFAAECSRNAGGSMAYMEKLLTGWAESGATTLEAAKAQHAARRPAASAEAGRPANLALDYAQREYKEEDFGDDFYFDYEKMFGKEEKP